MRCGVHATQAPMMSCHLILMWHECNANADDIMMTLFTLFATLVMSCLACMLHTHMHGACALIKNGMSKYLSGLACMQAILNLGKLTTSHIQVLNTQNANRNMPNIFPIAYLNQNLRYCNENLAWGKGEPLIQSYTVWYTTKGEKAAKTSFYFIYI